MERSPKSAFTWSKLTIETPEQGVIWNRSGVFIVNFEYISHIVLVFLLLEHAIPRWAVSCKPLD